MPARHPPSSSLAYLVMEETSTLLNEGDTQILRRIEDSTVILRASRGSDVLDTASGRSVHVVDEGELRRVRMQLVK